MVSPTLELIPARLAMRRQRQGLSQLALANVSGVAQSHIWRLEKGKVRASARVIKQLAAALECEMEDIAVFVTEVAS